MGNFPGLFLTGPDLTSRYTHLGKWSTESYGLLLLFFFLWVTFGQGVKSRQRQADSQTSLRVCRQDRYRLEIPLREILGSEEGWMLSQAFLFFLLCLLCQGCSISPFFDTKSSADPSLSPTTFSSHLLCPETHWARNRRSPGQLVAASQSAIIPELLWELSLPESSFSGCYWAGADELLVVFLKVQSTFSRNISSSAPLR